MEGNFRLHITIEGHIADSLCLFRYFKNTWPLTIITNDSILDVAAVLDRPLTSTPLW